MSPVTHVTLPNLTVSFAGEPELEFLSVVTISPDRRQLMFLWRHDVPAHVREALTDPTYQLETTRDVPLADFPTDAVTQTIRANVGEFPGQTAAQIIRLLEASR